VTRAGLWAALALVAGCTAPGPAPVSERAPARSVPPPTPVQSAARPPVPQVAPSSNGLHTVQRGETLYAIAFANNLDYRDLASWNQLESPDRIRVGEVLRLTAPPGAVEVKPLDDGAELRPRPLAEPPLLRTPQAVLMAYSDAAWAQLSGAAAATAVVPPAAPTAAPAPTAAAAATVAPAAPPPPAAAVESWLWPADGTLTTRFGSAGSKGIDIVGPRAAPVRAAAPGKVVYSGSGLRGLGRLLIIKHPGEFLSAYAHNDRVLVKEGDQVAAGQQIAHMGDSDADRVKLHFQIRRYGKPLDPLDYLPERS
jgi:lipoprotein NlpD